MKTNTKPKPAGSGQAYAKRREHPRFAVDVQASLTVGEKAGQRARTRDISRAGICLVSLDAIPRDTAISIELVLTFGGDGTSEPLHMLGEVVWCTSLFGAYQIGVKFVQVGDEQSRYLNMFIGFLDGSLSTGEMELDDQDADGSEDGRHDPDDPFKG